jgi:hypothetical protein
VDQLEDASQLPKRPGDPLATILATRIDHLVEPLAIASTILGETMYLVANDRQAEAIRTKGGTPYTPPEVAILRDLYVAVQPEVWAARLRLIHEMKKRYYGRLEP